MIDWDAEPFWQWWQAQQAVVPITAEDALTVHVTEQARLPRRADRNYQGLDKLKSLMGQGLMGVIVR